jgi:hypothetical protein
LFGYDFDTLGTRGQRDGIVRLATLRQYRHVVWYVDAVGATYSGTWMDPLRPITTLRMIESPGQVSTLAAYIRQGGHLWLMGGGAAYASLAPWDKAEAHVFTNRDHELVAGRFMYDFAHWRSAIHISTASAARKFVPENFPANAMFPFSRWSDSSTAPGRGWPGQPDYSALPQNLNARSVSNGLDPPPPLRSPDSFWFQADYVAEYLFEPNWFREDLDSDPLTSDELSTLDTLYFATGAATNGPKPVMTYYHPARLSYPAQSDTIGQPLVFSGFPLWFFRRSQEIPVADFVLQTLWGQVRQPVSREPTIISASMSRAGSAPSRPLRSPGVSAARPRSRSSHQTGSEGSR